MDLPLRQVLFDHYVKEGKNGYIDSLSPVVSLNGSDGLLERFTRGDYVFLHNDFGGRFDLLKPKPWTLDANASSFQLEAITFQAVDSPKMYRLGNDGPTYVGVKDIIKYAFTRSDLQRIRSMPRF